jgi:transcriptional regulator with GAF, ATPase, and Fis domain
MANQTTFAVRGETVLIRQFAVEVVEGPDLGARVVSASEEVSIGSAEGNELRVTDQAVSRHHCAFRAEPRGLRLVDLGSRNGTFIPSAGGELEVASCIVRSGARVRLGKTTLQITVLDHDLSQPLASGDRFGALLGGSAAMRRMYPLLEQCAASSATVLVNGETGTGKELIAEAIHATSARANQPFVVVDCSALSHDLAESELFGHERGAFTGADTRRIGAFESANGGTVFLDEIGELSLELQPLLLRVLEARQIRRIGENTYRPVDVRIIAASHRDLRSLVNDKRFRSDLFYRLNVLRVAVPPLRERTGDIELLAGEFWRAFRPDRTPPPTLLPQLAQQSWPGNVRELRNAVERAALIGWRPELDAPAAGTPALGDGNEVFSIAKEKAVWAWEKSWLERLLATSAGNLSRAARTAKMGRSHLRELCRRHGLIAPVADHEGDEE